MTGGADRCSTSVVGSVQHSPRTVLLLHGWPDDASTWDRVAPVIGDAGYWVIVPTLRGFAETRFLDATAPRTANSAVHAMDMIALLDALGVEKVAVVGHD
ncbi:MAG: alpha/beta fold hydrolase [Janthinobacterium lividum]